MTSAKELFHDMVARPAFEAPPIPEGIVKPGIIVEFPLLPGNTGIALRQIIVDYGKTTVYLLPNTPAEELTGVVLTNNIASETDHSRYSPDVQASAREFIGSTLLTSSDLNRRTQLFEIRDPRNVAATVQYDKETKLVLLMVKHPSHAIAVLPDFKDTIGLDMLVGDEIIPLTIKDFSESPNPHAAVQFRMEEDGEDGLELKLNSVYPYLPLPFDGKMLCRCIYISPKKL